MPFRCPVCEGHGTVSAGFYGPLAPPPVPPAPRPTIGLPRASHEPCRPCKGTGIVWRDWYPAGGNER